MARTKASVGAKISSGKNSKARCSAAPPSSNSNGAGGASSSRSAPGGGNPVCPRETPKWQRPITKFFISKDSSREEGKERGSGDEEDAPPERRRTRQNVIQSDSEEETPGGAAAAGEQGGDDTELQPLTGEDSRTIDEFYHKDGVKGKGKGKKSTNKENVDGNKRNSIKRDLEDIAFGEEPEQASKRVKVN